MDLIQCKVINGKFGKQVVHEGDFYRIGSFSESRVIVGREYMFLLEVKEYSGKTIRWANLPRKAEGDEPDEDESVPEKSKLKPLPAEPKPRRAPAKGAAEWKITKVVEENVKRVADALEEIAASLCGIEDMLDRIAGSAKNGKKGS